MLSLTPAFVARKSKGSTKGMLIFGWARIPNSSFPLRRAGVLYTSGTILATSIGFTSTWL